MQFELNLDFSLPSTLTDSSRRRRPSAFVVQFPQVGSSWSSPFSGHSFFPPPLDFIREKSLGVPSSVTEKSPFSVSLKTFVVGLTESLENSVPPLCQSRFFASLVQQRQQLFRGRWAASPGPKWQSWQASDGVTLAANSPLKSWCFRKFWWRKKESGSNIAAKQSRRRKELEKEAENRGRYPIFFFLFSLSTWQSNHFNFRHGHPNSILSFPFRTSTTHLLRCLKRPRWISARVFPSSCMQSRKNDCQKASHGKKIMTLTFHLEKSLPVPERKSKPTDRTNER